MARRIVCGFDESSGSRHAAPVAARLARDLESGPVLANVNPAGGPIRRFLAPTGGRNRSMRRALRAVAEEHCFPDDTVVRVKSGDPSQTLITIARRVDAELIVVGAGGRSTTSPVLLGQVTTALMLDAPCPVVVVPRDTVAPMDSESMRAVVCAVGGDESDGQVQRLARDLAVRLGGELHAVPGVAADLQAVAERERAGLIVVGLRDQAPVAAELAGSGRTAVVALPSEARLDFGSGHYELAAGAA
jgi:nucleotide-binding universal stress UspA family protein